MLEDVLCQNGWPSTDCGRTDVFYSCVWLKCRTHLLSSSSAYQWLPTVRGAASGGRRSERHVGVIQQYREVLTLDYNDGKFSESS